MVRHSSLKYSAVASVRGQQLEPAEFRSLPPLLPAGQLGSCPALTEHDEPEEQQQQQQQQEQQTQQEEREKEGESTEKQQTEQKRRRSWWGRVTGLFSTSRQSVSELRYRGVTCCLAWLTAGYTACCGGGAITYCWCWWWPGERVWDGAWVCLCEMGVQWGVKGRWFALWCLSDGCVSSFGLCFGVGLGVIFMT